MQSVPNAPNAYPNNPNPYNPTNQSGQMNNMNNMNNMMMPDKPAKSGSMVGVLAGVVVAAVIALIIVVVYFVAVRKCPTNPSGLDCSLSSGNNISCTANSANTACVCTYTGTNTDCTSCQPAAFEYDNPATYVSCTSTGCTGTLGPQGGLGTWGTGKTCTNLGTADSVVSATLSGDTLSSAVRALDGSMSDDATWGHFSTWCSQNGKCAGFSITPNNCSEYNFTPCGAATSGGASWASGTDQPGYASAAFLYLPNSLASTSQQVQQPQKQQQNTTPVKSKLPGWSA